MWFWDNFTCPVYQALSPTDLWGAPCYLFSGITPFSGQFVRHRRINYYRGITGLRSAWLDEGFPSRRPFLKLLVIAFSLFLVSTAFALQANLPQQTPTLSMRGKVLQEPGKQPIRKANVQLNGRTGPSAAQYSAITDSEGQFTIDDVQH